MLFKAITLVILFCLFINSSSFSQFKVSKFTVDAQMKDTFTFVKKWSYQWNIFKNETTGEFEKNTDEPFSPSDTAHLYYTASCTTNVQGGYEIRYCYSYKQNDTLVLTFSDGLPAYASEFSVYIVSDSFSFQPRLVFPVRTQGERLRYRIKLQSLVLNKSRFVPGDSIMGFINVKFAAINSTKEKDIFTKNYYLEGHFKLRLHDN